MKLKEFFSKGSKSESKPMGVITTVQRPVQPINRLSKEDHEEMMRKYVERKEESLKLSPYFIQEIFDRLYGPDAESYINEINELNSKYKPRHGRTGPHIYRDEI